MGLDRINPALHWKALWLAVGLGLIGLILFLSLMPLAPPSIPFIDIPHLDKVEHCLAYFTLMGWFIQLYLQPAQRVKLIWGFIALGILIEILQGMGGVRHADWKDALANASGVVLAWQLAKTSFSQYLERVEHWCRAYVS